MKIKGKEWRTIWLQEDGCSIGVIDQRKLPHYFCSCIIYSFEQAAQSIRAMIVRGAPLIGVTGAYGLMLALQKDPSDTSLENAYKTLISARPTAINLAWALSRIRKKVEKVPLEKRAEIAKNEANAIAEEDVWTCKKIGEYGFSILKEISHNRPYKEREKPLNVLTHCNAGWLATVDWGTALAPIYKAHRAGMKLHVWVDETRPRNQGANLTAFELACEGIPHTVIVDNAGGHLMQHGLVDVVIVGSDLTTKKGDVCNKIGTYLKALAAYENSIPFYVALPISSIDWSKTDGLEEIPIEIRSELEVLQVQGELIDGEIATVRVSPKNSKGFNPAFDVTPAKFITGLITEKGISYASESGLKNLYRQ
tara:strand:+ start:546 stop:1643 length:1098 start_codon:yes stop_codon:yes gene_type:complete